MAEDVTETGFVDGHPEPVVGFDYDAVEAALDRERGNPLVSEMTEASPKGDSDVVTLAKVFALLLTYGGTDANQFFITANVMAFTAGLHPNQQAGGAVIAAGLKMEKAAWSRRVNQMRKIMAARGSALGKIAGQWSEEAREKIKTKTKQSHEKRKTKRPGISGNYARWIGKAAKKAAAPN